MAYDASHNVIGVYGESGTLRVVYDYDPFGGHVRAGEATLGAGFPFRYSTKMTDDGTGLTYYGHRYYSAKLGRFINRDPIEESGGLNLYGFCGNDGVNRWDLLGMNSLIEWFSGFITTVSNFLSGGTDNVPVEDPDDLVILQDFFVSERRSEESDRSGADRLYSQGPDPIGEYVKEETIREVNEAEQDSADRADQNPLLAGVVTTKAVVSATSATIRALWGSSGSQRGPTWFRPEKHDFTVGRPGNRLVAPGYENKSLLPGGYLDDLLIAGHPFGANHDAVVEELVENRGFSDKVVNIPTMPAVYACTVFQQSCNTIVYIDNAINDKSNAVPSQHVED